MIVYAYETDFKLNPTGKEWKFKTKSFQDVISHIAKKNNGKITKNGRSVILNNGNRVFGIIIENKNE